MSEIPIAGEGSVGAAAIVGRPSGTVTFLFTDIEGSTRLWGEALPSMAVALERHDEIVRAAIEDHGGVVFATGGDGFAAAFSRASDAIGAAMDAQAGLVRVAWPDDAVLRVRIGLHSGEAVERDGDYFGPTVNVAARLMSTANAGQIVCSGVTAGLAGAQVPLRDLGEHHLRDVPGAVRVFQVGAGEFPVLRADDGAPSNLPAPVTSFVGRHRELREVAAALNTSRLVTLVGVGGMGKTRLAIHVAEGVRGRFRDGVYLVELASVTEPDGVAQVVASTLGVAHRMGLSLEDSIGEYLGARQLLVVLDNCEHVLAAAASLVRQILTGCPSVRILATSREALGVDGEQLWPVGPLTLPDASDDGDAASVQLLIDRARLVDPSFDPDGAGLDAVVEICRRLDGMPLAIELAASRLATMTPAEVAHLLDERFRLLTGGRRTAVERHQSLRAAVEWSYGLLADGDRAVFERLGVFVGSFDAGTAAAVVAGDDLDAWAVRDAVSSLVAKSLVGRVESSAAATRYQLAETLRAFARERLDASGDPDRWRLRHAEFFAVFGRDAAAALRGPDELAWWPTLEAELDDLRAAVTWALDSHEHRHLAVEIITDLAYVNQIERRFGIGRWAEQAMDVAADSPPGRRAVLVSLAADHMLQTGRPPEVARPLAEAAMADGIPPDCPAPAIVFLASATCTLFEGRFAEAAQITRDAVAEAPPGVFDAYHLAPMHCIAAAFSSTAGEHEEAIRHAELAVTHARRSQNPSVTGLALSQIGWAAATTDPTRAEAALTEAVALAEGGARLSAYNETLSVLARLNAARGNLNQAARHTRAAIAEAYRQGQRAFVRSSLKGALLTAASLGELELAAVLAGATLKGILSDLAAPRYIVPGGDAGLEEVARHVREELGDAEYEAAERRGASMEVNDVAEYALSALDAAIARTV